MISDKTILILEDEALVAMDIGDELRDRGWNVADVVGTLDAATRATQANVPDLAILDVNLRGHQSFDLAISLRAKGTTVLFLSGNTADELPDELSGCTFIQKPVQYDTLHDTLLAAIAPRSGTVAQ